jgi:hypothetical protein
MGFLDFLNSIASGVNNVATGQDRVGGFASDLAQRLAQQAVATGQGHFSASQDPNAPVGPSMIPGLQGLGTGVNVGDLNPLRNVPLLGGVTQGLMRAETLPLQLTGLGQEAFGSAGKDAAGLIGLAAALAQTHLGDPNSAATVNARMALDQGLAHPGRAITAMREGPDTPTSLLAGGLELATNPLNYVGGIGESGAALNTADNPAALQALGAALQGTARAGQLTNAPAEAAFGLAGRRGAFRFGFDPAPPAPTAAEVGAKFARDQAAAQAAVPAASEVGQLSLPATGAAAAPAASHMDELRLAATFSDDPAVAKAARAQLAALEAAPTPAAPEIAPPALGTAQALDRTIPPALASGLNPQDFATMPPAAPGQAKIATGRARTMFEQLMQDLGPTDSAEGFRRKLGVSLQYLSDRGYNPMSEAEGNRLPFAHGPLLQPDEAARLLAGGNAPQAAESGITQFLDQLPGRGAVSRTLTDIPALPEVTPPTGPAWTHYGPETIHPGEGVTPELLDQFAKVRRFPNPSPLDVESEIGAMRDPVTLLQQAYGNDWQNRLAALTGGKWGQPGSGAQLVNGKIMLGDLDLTSTVRDYLENRGGAQAGDFKGALKALLPEQGPTPASAAPSLSAPPAAPTGTLDDARALIQDHARQFNTRYPPLDAAFYAKRANVDPAQVPAMLDQLVSEGTLGRLPDGSLALKPPSAPVDRAAWQAKYVGQSQAGTDILAQGDKVGGSDLTQADLNALSPQERMAALRKLAAVPAPVAPPAELLPDLGPQANDLIAGIEDAVRGGRVDEANYLVATAADYGVPVSRAQAVLNAAADAGGKGAGVDAQRQAIEQSPYARVFQYFNRDGQLKRINPQTGARLTSKAHYGGDEIWNLPDSGYDEVAAAALSSPEFGNNQNFGQTSDEFWRNAQSAFRQYQGLKKPGVQFGGDLAAGGGGFGLVPMSTGRVVGGLGGTLVGGGLGFAAPAPDTETRMKRAATGALLGGTLGTGLGSTPQGEALAEEALAGNRAAWQSGSKQIMPTGVSNAVSSLRATQKTALMTIPRNIMDNTIKQALGGKSPVKYLGDLLAQSREWGATLPALRNAGDEQQRMHVMLQSLGPDFANRDPESMARLAVKQGMDYNLDPEDLGTAGAYPPVSAARGAVGALAQPTKLLATGFLTPAVGAAEGLTLAGRAALQNAALTPADMIGRFAFSMPDYTRQLADAAPAFIKKVAASGQSTALLDQEGRFGASLIKDPTLRAEWEAIQQAAEDAGASVALDHMGDFGTHGAFRKITNNAAPGGVWNIGQSQLLARRAAEHPALATGAIRAAFDNYQRALAAGHPDEAGTATIDQDTPGLGLLARLTNGGAAGPLHIPLTYSGSPIGPEVFDVPRQLDPYLHPNQQLYDKIKTITGAAGLGTNPVLDMAAYRLGISDTPHAGASRWAPLGTYAEQAAHAAGIPLLGALAENPVADLLNPAAKPGDVQQQLRTNRYLDPAAIAAGNEMIYEQRGTSSSDPKNVDLVAQLRDPNSDFYQAALARGLGARAGSALVGEVVPGHPQAQTATAYAAEAAKTALLNQGLPLTRAQVQEIAARPDGGVVLSQIRQAQIDAAKLQDPLLALQDVSSPQDLGAKVFQQWQRENGGLAGFPIVYNILAQREQERLGLVPLGTAMAQQQAYDQLNAGQAYGRPQPYPGVQPLPFDPQPMYDLYRLFGGGR